MKLSINWKQVVATALLAAGIWAPRVVQAANIPLADPSFENFAIPTDGAAGFQYAYASNSPSNFNYRPTSGWIDDQDGVEGAVEDDANSNWIYTSAYGEKGPLRGAPRTGNQAMHGGFNYSSQESGAVFEAGKSYVFSVYAQGDDNAELNATYGWESRVWMYIFDGNQPFSEANSLNFKRFSPTDQINIGANDFVNRDPLWDATQSQAGWQKISLSWTVKPGAPEIGHPIGVGLYIGGDGAVDDASLIQAIPGDFDLDDDVDGADFVIWQTNFPKTNGASLSTGDADGDGDVDGADFVVWQTNFPTTAGAAVSPVPEPGSIVLLVGAMVGLAGFRRFASKPRQ